MAGLAVLTNGCQAERPGFRPDELESRSRPPSPAESRAAALLSPLGGATLNDDSPYRRAVSCGAALGTLPEQLKNSPLLGDAELRAISQAAELFTDRARRLASGEGRTAAEASADLADAAEKVVEDPDAHQQTAAICIGLLQREFGG